MEQGSSSAPHHEHLFVQSKLGEVGRVHPAPLSSMESSGGLAQSQACGGSDGGDVDPEFLLETFQHRPAPTRHRAHRTWKSTKVIKGMVTNNRFGSG